MIAGFQKYLIDNGFKRYKQQYERGKMVITEDNDSMAVSTFGPVFFMFVKDETLYLYWGLCLKDRSPYFHLPNANNDEFFTSGDYAADLTRLLATGGRTVNLN